MTSHGDAADRPDARTAGADDVLGSWKEIAAYLERDVRTVMRWEQSRHLPVHRLPGDAKAAVYALKSELEAWRAAANAPGPTAPSPVPSTRRLRLVFTAGAAALLLLLLVLSLRYAWQRSVTAAPPIHSLAVLPFENLNKDPAQDYFADGMHETLLTDLARAGGVSVTSHTSVEHYRGGAVPTRQIARELGVDALVEGSVLRAGNRVRITAQLVRGDTEAHIWANSYDRDVSDVLALLAQVSDAITAEIQKAVAGTRRAEPVTPRPAAVAPRVLDTYLRARFAFHTLSRAGLENALELNRQATELDPRFPLAWCGIASTRTAQAFFGFVSPDAALPEAREAARKALELDDGLGEAHGTLGYIALYWDRDFEAARRSLERAVALSPHSTMTRHEYADYLLAQGQVEESLAQVKIARANDPVSWPARGIVLYHSLMAKRYADVVSEASEMVKDGRGTPVLHDYLARALWMQGRHEAALAEWKAAFRLDEKAFARVEDAYRRGGATAAILQFARLAAADADEDRQAGAVVTASLFAAGGAADEAFSWLNQADSRREPFLLHVVADPFFDPIRSDPRLPALLHRLGVAGR